MADRSKFEEMLELLVNEDKEGAEALFHEIVVEKSRDIYESLLEDEEVDESDDEVEEASDEEVDESDEDLDEADEEVDESDDDLEEGFDLDEFEVEADPMMGGDPADDMMGDMEPDMDDDDMDMDDEGDMEDRVEDLEDALEDLKAEFEKMMAGDDEGDDDMDMDMDDEEPEEEGYAFEAADEEVDEAADEEVDEAADEEVDESDDEEVEESTTPKSASEQMREYVEKVAPAKMGDNGANAKSVVASKNDMGGTTANILRADTEQSGEAGAGTTIKGNPVQKQAPAAMNTKNINVPGGKAGKTGFKKSEPGHGAEKKGKPETADKGAGSMLNGAPKRAK